MCSIFKYGSVVGRNFDYEQSFNEELRVIEKGEYANNLYKIIGMCTGIVKDYPLLYDGMNEYGLVCGGLAFQGNAWYDTKDARVNVPSWQFPLIILGRFKSVSDVLCHIENMNISNEAFSDEMPPSDLHWFIADKDESIIVEQTKKGLQWYDGDVMTNNPPYDYQKVVYESDKTLIKEMNFYRGIYETRGKNTYGLKGDYTSEGRFVRLKWLKEQLENHENSFNPVSQAFHLCASVEQIYGATPVNDKFEYTIYSVVYDMENKIIFYKYYDDVLYTDAACMEGFPLLGECMHFE